MTDEVGEAGPGFGEVPIHVFEGKRVDVSFFRLGPEPERTIRERYKLRRQLGVNSVGSDSPQRLNGAVRIVERDGGLWDAAYVGGIHLDKRLKDLTWEDREHLLGALTGFLDDLHGYDREDAQQYAGRHEGHHHHMSVTYSECSCGVMLGIHTGVGDLSKTSCTECGQQGVVFRSRRQEEPDG